MSSLQYSHRTVYSDLLPKRKKRVQANLEEDDWTFTISCSLDTFAEWPNGYSILSNALGCGLDLGLEQNRVIIIAATTGVGKTTLANQIATDFARLNSEKNVIYFSTELKRDELVLKSISRIGGIDYARLRSGIDPSKEELDRLSFAIGELAKIEHQLFYRDRHINLRSIAGSMDTIRPALVVIDYAQEIPCGRPRDGRPPIDRLLRFAREASHFGTTCIILSAVNRGSGLAEMRDSSKLEYDAEDIRYLLPDSTDPSKISLRCKKMRFGERRDFKLLFRPNIQRFDVIERLEAT